MTQRFVIYPNTDGGRKPALMCGYIRATKALFVMAGLMDKVDNTWQFYEEPIFDVDIPLPNTWNTNCDNKSEVKVLMHKTILSAVNCIDRSTPSKNMIEALISELLLDAEGHKGNLRFVHSNSTIEEITPEHEMSI